MGGNAHADFHQKCFPHTLGNPSRIELISLDEKQFRREITALCKKVRKSHEKILLSTSSSSLFFNKIPSQRQ